MKGSFVRVGDSDERMTEYEVYSYEAFRKKYQDDVREIPRASLHTLDEKALNGYIEKLKNGKPNLSEMSDRAICELLSVTRNNADSDFNV